MFSYAAYGLGIHSTFELPELVRGNRPADATISIGPVDFDLRPPSAQGSDWIWATADQACLTYPGTAKFHVQSGRTVTIDLDPHVDHAHLRLLLLGPVLSLLLHQRGYMLLHSSCIAVGDG